MNVDPRKLTTSERYKLLIGAVLPRPIAVVSTVSPDGVTNVAPYSFFNAAGAEPMSLVFCPVTAANGEDKNTLRNALPEADGGTGEFVVNVAVEGYARQVAAAAAELPYGESEFSEMNIEEAASAVVAAPRVAAAPISFECRTAHVLRLNAGVPSSGTLVVGEVVHVWVRDDLVNERMHIDAARLAAIGRMGGAAYTRTRETFDLPRGHDALTAPLPFEGGTAPASTKLD